MSTATELPHPRTAAASIGEALFQTYILQAFRLQSDDELRQQEEQQQQ
jgi:hypothetical protein